MPYSSHSSGKNPLQAFLVTRNQGQLVLFLKHFWRSVNRRVFIKRDIGGPCFNAFHKTDRQVFVFEFDKDFFNRKRH